MNNESDPFVEAKSFEDQQRFDLAAEQYQKAVDLGIDDQALAHQGRARALARLGRLEEALDECQKALKLKPELPFDGRIFRSLAYESGTLILPGFSGLPSRPCAKKLLCGGKTQRSRRT
jgi:tetratricopeptide (TPR) repeat protein